MQETCSILYHCKPHQTETKFFQCVFSFGQINAEKFKNLLYMFRKIDKQIVESNRDMKKKNNTDKDGYYGMFIINRYEINNININIDR